MGKTVIEHYWQNYLQTLPEMPKIHQTYRVEQLGDMPERADELGQLILDGIKIATCSALWEWEADQKSLPNVGSKTIILGGTTNPICIIETTEVTVRAFNEIDARFAYDEGECDRTLATWQQQHWAYFSRVLPKLGKAPTPDMLLVCERFRVVYQSLPQGFIIRDCEPTEAGAVLSLWRDAGATVSLTDDLDSIVSAITATSVHFLVAEHDYQLIGLVLGAFDGWRGNIYRLAVHPDFRRLGVATKLVAEIEQRFAKQGVKRITALVDKEHDDAAMSFWQTVDYTVDTRIVRFIHNL